MRHTIVWIVIVLASVFLLDRGLLRMESRGWINYRTVGLSRGAAMYHTLELQSIYDPGARQVVEIRYQQRKQQDDSGEPLLRITFD
jgi:hypothetical protein